MFEEKTWRRPPVTTGAVNRTVLAGRTGIGRYGGSASDFDSATAAVIPTVGTATGECSIVSGRMHGRGGDRCTPTGAEPDSPRFPRD